MKTSNLTKGQRIVLAVTAGAVALRYIVSFSSEVKLPHSNFTLLANTIIGTADFFISPAGLMILLTLLCISEHYRHVENHPRVDQSHSSDIPGANLLPSQAIAESKVASVPEKEHEPKHIYIYKNDAQIGPFGEDQARGMVSGGSITADDFAWHEGLSDWQPIRSILNLHEAPAITPPQQITAVQEAILPDARPSILPGVAGWLTFFCFLLTIDRPVHFICSIISKWDALESAAANPSLWAVWIFIESFCAALILAYGIVIGLRIWLGNPAGRSLAKQYLILQLIGSICLNIISSVLMHGSQAQTLIETAAIFFIYALRDGFWFLIWWYYFKKSKRVKNTYGSESA